MKRFKKIIGEIPRNILFGLKISYQASKRYFILKCFILLLTSFLPLLTFWLWKEILNDIAFPNQMESALLILLASYLVLQLVTYLLTIANEHISKRYGEELNIYISDVMIDKVSRVDLSFFDSSSMADKVRHARNNLSSMGDMTWLTFDIISEAINVVVAFSIICTFRWWIGIVTLLLMLPFALYNRYYSKKRLALDKEQLIYNRKLDYYAESFKDNNVQFEMKLNNTGPYFLKEYFDLRRYLYKINHSEKKKYQILNGLFSFLNVASSFIVLGFSTGDVLAGVIGIGDLQYNLNMLKRFRDQATKLVSDGNRFLLDNAKMNELKEFMDIRTEAEKSGALVPSANPKIEFCNVSFRYPNSNEDVLKNCSFCIEPNEKVGLIGLNGAGKSTIIKLLFRFYDPREGSIKLDGIDLKEYNIYEVRKVFGVLFQDYVTYSLPLREIIALSDFDHRFDNERLDKACTISGANKIFANWKDGYDTVLGRYYTDNGAELSGGQWQLVALSRAYFKDSSYMILDEPSAALDPISEDRIFEQLYELSKGKSSITISHRLSNTTLADKILVIGDGHIIEQGSHPELLRKNGQYAHLFNLQASRYQ